MKPTSWLVACLLLAAGSTPAAYLDEILADQPVGYWRLGDPATSALAANAGSLGTAADGSLVNGVSLEFPGALTGDTDTAAYLDGAQSRIEIPFAPGLNSPAFTIEVWAMVGSGSEGVYRSPFASRDDNPQKGFILYCTPANEWEFWTGTGEQVGWNAVAGGYAEPDTWTHLVGVFDGTNKLLYVNGVLAGANQSRFTPNGARPLRLGASANESPVGDFFFVGALDEAAVYDRVLPQDRIVAHYRAATGSAPSSEVPPQFVVQPASADRFRNESVTLTALATGSLPLSYQWRKNDADIAGATGPSLTLSSLQPADSATYTVLVRNSAGESVSDGAVLEVADVTRPVITRQPRDRTVLPGATVSLTVAATGSTAFAYQWLLNDVLLAGATNATLTVSNLQSGQLGAYRVTVTNPAGSTDSDLATVQFPAPATKSYTDTVRDDAPAGYWRLGESSGDLADDAVGANDGFYLNGVTLGRPGAPLGDPNTAAGFSTANQSKIDIAWAANLNAPVFTAECWARVDGGAGAHRSPLTSRADGPQRGYIFYAEPGNTWQFWTGTGELAGWTTLSGPPVRPGTYDHLVGLYDGTRLAFYVNGVLVSEREAAFGPNDEWPLRIGGGATETDGNFFFQGDVDEVAIYDQALGEDRILAHYVAGFPLTTPPTITLQPVSQLAPPGATVTFAVVATGGLPLAYQWRFNSQDLPAATGSSLVLSNVTQGDTGTYEVIVSNAGGTVNSLPVTLAIPAPPSEPYATLVAADGPVGYWRLGETSGDLAEDSAGDNDGTYLNGVLLGTLGALAADPNTAATFVSADRHKIDVPWSDLLNAPVFTAEVWARVTGGAGNYRSPLTSRADSPQRGYIFYAEPGNTWQFWSGRGDTSGWDSIPGPAVRTNHWTHLVATYDGTTKRFYVNGVQAGTSSGAFGVNDASPLRIGGGASEGDGNYFFQGDVDEVAIYAKALSHERILLHYLAGSPPVAAPVLDITREGASIRLTWSGGTLESASALPGAWNPVAGATSPWTLQPAEAAAFYRLRQ